ncbi:MAG TPA: chlorite dismutase family protein [Thermomicrobiaceae bacterium]|nr:chlorite dismutase family protein [Thermomicrobiaceae bacterium]
MAGSTAYTVFWIYQATPEWRRLSEETRARARQEFIGALEHAGDASVRGVYSTVGFRPDADLIIWSYAQDADALQRFAVQLRQTTLGGLLTQTQAYLGIAGGSQYDPSHGPAFMKGIPPRRYLSVYPFTKTPDWFLLPFEERRRLMRVHGELGQEYPTILTNTVNSFGIQDQEFIVALEDDDPGVLVEMVQRLRGAEVRRYTQVDTPIYLGRLLAPDEALCQLG